MCCLLIQKRSQALRSYATAVHGKLRNDGYKPEGITYPSGADQAQLWKEVYAEAGVNPADVCYVEAHGTGTKAGDPQETSAICEVFCKNRTEPLLIGSVKSNLGHGEAVSGMSSLVKVQTYDQFGCRSTRM